MVKAPIPANHDLCTRFFNPVRKAFTRPARDHFWMLVLAITLSHSSTIDRLAKLLRGPAATHRTNHGDPRGFLWRSDWDESWVLRQIALDTLRRVMRRGVKDKRCYFILDDTQTLKRAKKRQGVGRLYHHATKTYGRGHTIFKVCLYIHGVTISWGSYLYIKKNDAPKPGVAFKNLTRWSKGFDVEDQRLTQDFRTGGRSPTWCFHMLLGGVRV